MRLITVPYDRVQERDQDSHAELDQKKRLDSETGAVSEQSDEERNRERKSQEQQDVIEDSVSLLMRHISAGTAFPASLDHFCGLKFKREMGETSKAERGSLEGTGPFRSVEDDSCEESRSLAQVSLQARRNACSDGKDFGKRFNIAHCNEKQGHLNAIKWSLVCFFRHFVARR
jgi:hypothetical protein